jgi:broad specificity phosphatase PhoE
MEIVFVRHGLPDYRLADERQMSQLEKDYSPLARSCIDSIIELGKSEVFSGCSAMSVSPYTRAMQTAELINRHLQLDLYVEHDLREWRADIDGGVISLQERDRRWHEYRAALKDDVQVSGVSYEQHDKLRKRVLDVISHYREHEKIIVVGHFNVLEALLGYQEEGIACGGIRCFSINEWQ